MVAAIKGSAIRSSLMLTTIGIEAKKKKDSFFSEGSMRSAIIESGSNNFNKNPTQ